MLETAGAGLRPLSTTGIVDAAIEHVRDEPVLYYGIVAPVSLPLAALALLFLDTVRDYRGDPAAYGPRVAALAAALAVLFHLRFVAQGALAWVLERRLNGLEATPLGAWRAALRRSLTLVFAGTLLWVLVPSLALLGGLPGLLPLGLLGLGPTVAILEGRGPLGTLRRSVQLGWHELARAVLVAFILALGAVVLGVGSGLALQALLDLARTIFHADLSFTGAVLSFKNPTFVLGALLAGIAFLEPVKTLSFALLYVDRRVRTEGFDLRRKVQLILDRERGVAVEAAP